MNIKKYLKKAKAKKSRLPYFYFGLPCIPVIFTIVHAIIALNAQAANDATTTLFAIYSLAVILSYALPVCCGTGLALSLLDLRNQGKKKRIIAGIILNVFV